MYMQLGFIRNPILNVRKANSYILGGGGGGGGGGSGRHP